MRKEPTIADFGVWPSYKGGYTCTQRDGYIWEFAPTHHLANRWGWVAQHRMIGEDIAGRPLRQLNDPDREVVHHIDEVKTNNAPSNLQVMTFRDHMRHHMYIRNIVGQMNLSDVTVSAALANGGIFAAAKELGVHHQTLRNRFPDLVQPYLRASPIDLRQTLQRERLIETVRWFADTEYPLTTVAKLLRTCAKAIHRICDAEGIEWVYRTGRGGRGKLRSVYGGKPTRRVLELDGLPIAPAAPETHPTE